MAEEVIDTRDIQMRGSDPAHVKAILDALHEYNKKEKKLKEEPVDQPVTPKTTEIEELEKYRETERQTILQELPKELQEEYKEKDLNEVKKLSKLYKTIEKRNVGQEPPTTPAESEKPYRWCYTCSKNHSGECS